jgi:hypothetical protein
MKTSSLLLALLFCFTPMGDGQSRSVPHDGKIRVFVDANGSTDFAASGSATSGLFGGARYAVGSAHYRVAGTEYQHSQRPEVIKTLGERCPNVTVTMDKDRAFFLLSVEHESAAVKGLARRRNHITIVNRGGDVIFSKNDRELGNAIKDACSSMELTPEQISSIEHEIDAAAATRTSPVAAPSPSPSLASTPVPAEPPEAGSAKPQTESLGDVARRLRAQREAQKQQTTTGAEAPKQEPE